MFMFRCYSTVLLASSMSVAISATEGDLVVNEFAKSGMVGSVVGITTDPTGTVYVSNTNRRTNAAVDIRKNTDWLLDTLASTSVADKRALIHKRMPDWKKLEAFTELVIAVKDTDGDGKADKQWNAFSGLGTDINGVAAGVLWYDNALYITSFPSLYKVTDPDGDGVFDKQEELVTGFGIHVGYGGHDMHGPTLGMDGRIYWSMGDKGYHVEHDGKKWYGPGMGAVFRIEPDGTGFEVFCNGLRNPQELAFDAFGNLFTADHDGDFGDKEGLRFLVAGSDGGWRAHYQYHGSKRWPELLDYNPWMADSLWVPPKPEHPAYFTPVFQQLPGGPIGFEWEPGTALNDRYRGYFFLADSTKKIWAFKLTPKGAGFIREDEHTVLNGPFSTGLYFGADGKLYAADWGDNAWAPHMNGRVLSLDDPKQQNNAARTETLALLREDLRTRSHTDLRKLIAHADQRVRLHAQFALVAHGKAGQAVLTSVAQQGELLERVHAIWGLGMLARRQKNTDAGAVLVKLLADPDPEIRAQCAKMIGEAHLPNTGEQLALLLADASPRVRLCAGVALGSVGPTSAAPQAIKMLEENDNRDVYLRHAGIMALTSNANREDIYALTTHSSRSVRLAAVVALRQLSDPEVARFLNDSDQSIVREAALAIHDDLSIPAALPALAAVLERDGLIDDGLLRRAISANLRLGDDVSAKRLVAIAGKATAPADMRAEAIGSLQAMLTPLIVDRVQGFHRGLPARDRALVLAAVEPALESLVFTPSKPVQAATTELIATLKLPGWGEKLTTIACDTSKDVPLRLTALTALHGMNEKSLTATITTLLEDSEPRVRGKALQLMVERKANDAATYERVQKILAGNNVVDQQSVIAALSTTKHKRAVAILDDLLKKWEQKKLDVALHLDVTEAVRTQNDKNLVKRLSSIEKTLIKQDKRGLAVLAREGGDPVAGEIVYRTNTTGSCQQCHLIGGGIVTVGPNLSGIGKRLTRDQLLTALVDPMAEIAEGFGVVNVTLKDGSIMSGALASETDAELMLRPIGGIAQPVAKDKIATRSKPVSIMPPMGANLSPRELRDLIAYLASLKD